MTGLTPVRRRHNPDSSNLTRRAPALSPLALSDPSDVFGTPQAEPPAFASSSKLKLFTNSPPPPFHVPGSPAPAFLRNRRAAVAARDASVFASPEKAAESPDFRHNGLLSPTKKKFVPGKDVPLSPIRARHHAHRRRDSTSSVGSVGSLNLDDDFGGSDVETEVEGEAEWAPKRARRADEAVVQTSPDARDKGKGKEENWDEHEDGDDETDDVVPELIKRAASMTRPAHAAAVTAVASELELELAAVRAVDPSASRSSSLSRSRSAFSHSRSRATFRSLKSSRLRATSRSEARSASRSLRSASLATSRASASAASASASAFASASAASALNSLESSASSISESVISSVNSQGGLTATSATASASTASSLPSATSAVPSSASSLVPTSSAAAAASSLASASVSASASSAASASAASASSSSIAAGADGSKATSSNRAHRLEKIVIPSVLVPVGCLVILVAIILCCRRSRRKEGHRIGSPTPSSFGAMGSPRGADAAYFAGGTAGGMFGARNNYAHSGGSEPGLVAGPAFMSERGTGNESTESFATSPSAIGVAVGEGGYGQEPRTNWGRRSLRDVVAGGSMAAAAEELASPMPERPNRDTDVSFVAGKVGRQPSISSINRGVGGYNSQTGYQPGMQRPVHSPHASVSSMANFDPYPAVGSTGVAYTARDGAEDGPGIRPVSDGSEWTDSNAADSYYGGSANPDTHDAAYEGVASPPLTDLSERDEFGSSMDGEPATSARSPGSNAGQPQSLAALHALDGLGAPAGQFADAEDASPEELSTNLSASSSGLSAGSPQVQPVNFNSSSGESQEGGAADLEGTPRADRDQASGPSGVQGKDGAWW